MSRVCKLKGTQWKRESITADVFPIYGTRCGHSSITCTRAADLKLLELVKLRASLINGRAYCVDMHTKVARSLGETEQCLYVVSLWRETPFYTECERAALAWTEAITLVSVDHVPDSVYETARQHFEEKDVVALTAVVVAINGWNRLAIAVRTVPGTFRLGKPAPGDRDAYPTGALHPKGTDR